MLRPRPIPLLRLCLLGLLAGASTRCALPEPRHVEAEPRGDAVYVIAGGWHTELALPASAIGGPLVALKSGFPGAGYLVFGWGSRDYYMAQDPGLGDLLRAAVPGPAVLLVVPLALTPQRFFGAADVVALPLSREGAAHLSQLLWRYLAKDSEGVPRRIGPGPYSGSVFYASTGTFDLTHTCNTWTAEALHVAGLPVSSAGVVYVDQLLDQLPPRPPR